MTVGELTKKLMEYPEHLEVAFCGDEMIKDDKPPIFIKSVGRTNFIPDDFIKSQLIYEVHNLQPIVLID